MFVVNYCKTNGIIYINFDDIPNRNFQFEDGRMANLIKLDVNTFRELLIKNFEAYLYPINDIRQFTCFYSELQAQNACDFLNQSYKLITL